MSAQRHAVPEGTLREAPTVWLDEYGLLRCGPEWVALSIREWRLMQPLVERLGSVVPFHELIAAAWDGSAKGEGALNVLIRRTRRRIEPLGLDLTNVRGRGYVLDRATSRAMHRADRDLTGATNGPLSAVVQVSNI